MLTKKIYKTVAVALIACGATSLATANEGAGLLSAHNDVSDTASVQRGARNFVNYCFGCHSAKYVQYNRIASDLGLTEEQVKENLMFTGKRTSETMQNAMSAEDGKKWFSNAPPDLSLIARSRTPDYLYTFLKSFYLDPSRPTGVNNHVLEGAAMPNVLAELQGIQKAVYTGDDEGNGNLQKHFKGFELVSKGSMSAEEFDVFVRDTVNFLDYIGEPIQLERKNLGYGVLFFLFVFFGFAYALKKEYWKDVK
jgi:ubiquinol-cytochrome c reductase cytochrome c1 subunit